MLGNEVSLGESLIVTLFSMALVFVALIIISFILDGFKATFHKDNKTAEKKPVAPKTAAVTPKVVTETAFDDSEVVAVITAAIAATLSKSTKDINIKAIRRIPQQSPVWANAGRQEQMY